MSFSVSANLQMKTMANLLPHEVHVMEFIYKILLA